MLKMSRGLYKLRISKTYKIIKRFLDFILSTISLVVLAVPLLIVAIVIYIDDPGNVIFSQERVGYKGKLFKLYKFRSMKISTPKYLATSEVANPDEYITKIGHIIRKYSIDELPQLFNVFLGDMSIVGPRPLIANENDIHAMRMKYGVYAIKPGITGLAQINGRDTVSPAEKVAWDKKYLDSIGLITDIKIVLETAFKVVRGRDVVEGYHFEEQER